MPTTQSLLDSLTAGLKTSLAAEIGSTAILTVTAKTFHRTYNITGVDGKGSPFSRYAVHVLGTADQVSATAVMTDQGVTRRGPSSSQKVVVDLSNTEGSITTIKNFLLTGTQG